MMCGMNEFHFIRGEIRKITYELCSKTDRNFGIETASVELFHGNDMICELPVEIINHDIEFIVDTTELKHNYYSVIMTCRINEETVKKKMNFEVTR